MLQQRNVRFELVLDEGMPITVGVLKQVQRPIALIGTAEKGYVEAEIR